ncbi:transcriptional regulator NrdR [Lactobacillus terrae]|uniref:transcriptional regulator NrdR n=1 Tax=Lactobacillus terrae TaxID=2269374 RepID=UPI000C1B6E83|nr:transcriptional regulator NrdR [Lactobacillus terrae]
MNCPKCHGTSLKVLDSRPCEDGMSIRRRRLCESCGNRITTYERIEITPILVVKKNGDRESFDRDKILKGLVRSSERRPVSIDQLNELVDQVENELIKTGKREIASQDIGEIIMKLLSQLDDVAYIRFASVYREFKDMNGFMQEVQEMIKNEKSKEG